MASEMSSFNTPWLTLSIFVPIVCGLILLAVGRDDRPGLTRNLSLIGSILSFLVTIPLYTGFELPPWCGRDFFVVCLAHRFHYDHCCIGRLGSHHIPYFTVHGRFLDFVGSDDWRICSA